LSKICPHIEALFKRRNDFWVFRQRITTANVRKIKVRTAAEQA